jgi:hypothetical protein
MHVCIVVYIHESNTCFHVSSSDELHIEYVMLGKCSGPKKSSFFSLPIYWLYMNLSKTCILRIGYGWVVLEVYGGLFVFFIVGPSMYIEKFFCYFFEVVYFVIFDKVGL